MKPKTIGCLAAIGIILVIGFLMRVNLAPNDVARHVEMEQIKQQEWYERVLGEVLSRAVLSDPVANWKYYDLLVIKVAHSDRLDLLAVAVPFRHWMIFDISEKND